VRRLTASTAAWKAMTAAIEKAGERVSKAFTARRATVKRERANPPPMIKKVSFCTAAATENHPAATLDQ
jgi:hypothetical protein